VGGRRVTSLVIDPEFKALIPPLRPDERAELEASIASSGCRDPLTVWGDFLVDGHNRYEICTRLGLPFAVWQIKFDDRLDALIWIRKNSLARRNLTEDQRAMNFEALRRLESEKLRRERSAAARRMGGMATPQQVEERLSHTVCDKRSQADAIDTKASEKTPEPRSKPDKKQKRDTRDEVAKAANLPRRKLSKASLVIDARPDLADQVEQGEIKLADAVREIKRAEVIEKLESVEAREQKELAGEYDVIVIDPPWPMQKIERDVAPNQVAFEYPVMQEGDIAALKMPAAGDCHMWLWTTHKFLPMALRLLDAWGFKYVCTFVWHKPGGFQPIGLPQYNCEFALYARKGSPKFIDTKAFPVCFNAARGAHSEKPGEFYEVVRRVTAGRRIDIFNRRAIDGFDVWGKESSSGEGIRNAG
jgi:N6-adenosine-specific RNA methylase IME4